MATCEICGTKVLGEAILVQIEGAILAACASCSKLGTPVVAKQVKAELKRNRSLPAPLEISTGAELGLRPEYPELVKSAREKLGMRQDQLGGLVGEKASVISLIERGKLRPTLELARKLERVLKIRLLTEEEA